MLSPTLRYIHPSLEIPANVQAEAFPDATLSVLDFLQFSLPIISGAASRHNASEFFSNEQPTTQDIKTIQKIPIPPANTLALLVTGCKAAVLSGARSVKCPHAPSASAQSLPMWIIPYWAEILELRTTSRKAWVQAEEFIRRRKKVWKRSAEGGSTDAIMQEAYDMLSCLPWSGNIHGFDEMEPLYTLATYASHQWLTTTHENQILDLLRRDLLLQGSKVEIAGMAFFTTLRKAYDCCDTGQYSESRAFTWIRGIGTALVMGERDGLGTMVNTGGNHWVAIALDFQRSVIWYGDSFGHRPVEEVTQVLDWWTFHHTGDKFIYRTLKITAQKDGYSCGLLGTNALGHFYRPDTYPLIDVAKADAERVRVMLKVAQRHLDQATVSMSMS
jgi:hypothetical protein